MTIVSEDSPDCGQSGRVKRVFWREKIPWLLVRFRIGGMRAVPWDWTDLPIPQVEHLPRLTRLPSSSLPVPCETWSAFYTVMAASPTKGNPMIEYFGLFSTVMTFARKRIAVHSDSMMIVIRVQGRRRAGGVHSGGDLSACSRSLSMPSAKRFRWTNAAVLDTVRWANTAVGASGP